MGHLGTKRFLDTPSKNTSGYGPPFWIILGTILGPKIGSCSGYVWGCVLDQCLDTCSSTVRAILGAFVAKRQSEIGPFLQRLLGTVWSHLRRLLGCLGGLWGSYLSFLGWLSGVALDLKMEAKIPLTIVRKVCHYFDIFWTSLGTLLGTVLEVKSAQKENQK